MNKEKLILTLQKIERQINNKQVKEVITTVLKNSNNEKLLSSLLCDLAKLKVNKIIDFNINN